MAGRLLVVGVYSKTFMVGGWMVFTRSLAIATVLLGVIIGLDFVWKKGFKRLISQVDNMFVVKLLMGRIWCKGMVRIGLDVFFFKLRILRLCVLSIFLENLNGVLIIWSNLTYQT